MSWFKELNELRKMMFNTKPSQFIGKDLEIRVMDHFPFRGYRYMMWCGVVLCRSERKEVLDRFLNTSQGKISQTHEKGHCIQAISKNKDSWLKFYADYIWYWIKLNPIMHPASAAYYCNRFEVEAYAQEEHPEYWKNYNRDNLNGKYNIKHAKKLYRELGCNSRTWKTYVKSL